MDDAAEPLIRSTQKEFPVVDGAGHLRGVLTRDAKIRALKEQGPTTPVIEVMQHDIPTVEARSKLDAALKLVTSAQAKPSACSTPTAAGSWACSHRRMSAS